MRYREHPKITTYYSQETSECNKRQVLGFTPSYSMHPLIAKVTGSSWIDGKRNADFSLNTADAVSEILKHKPTLTFITTPNNPTGGAVTIDAIQMHYLIHI